MPESYTGTEGTAAFNAGLTIMDGTEEDRKGYLSINRVKDQLVAFVNAAVGAISLTWSSISGKPSEFPPSAHSHTINDIRTADNSGPYGPALQVVLDSKFPVAGGTVSGNIFLSAGHVYVPAATPATSGWQVAYINSDGRLARGSSSERYKKYISEIDPASLGDIFPTLSRFQMRGGDGTWTYGYIAERLAEHDDQRPFVVYADHDGELVPDSIDFIPLLMAQNAQLHQAIDLLVQRIQALEDRHAED